MAFPNHFTSCGLFDSSPATAWSHVSNYANQYVWTCYFFASTTKGNGPIQWNNAMAIKLLIDKCNALQAQVDALGEPADINMDAILSAMVSAEYEQLQSFIGIVDAYRVALWNEWFNVEYYAALARGFKR